MILEYLLDNRERLKSVCIPLMELDCFSLNESDILCRSALLRDVTKSLACSAEDAMLVIEDLDLKEYIK